jgi:hypothetical protein
VIFLSLVFVWREARSLSSTFVLDCR